MGEYIMKSKAELSKLLSYYLIDNEITIKELAEKMNVSRGSIYNWIDGKNISNRNYIKIVKFLDNYSPSQWITDKDKEELEKLLSV